MSRMFSTPLIGIGRSHFSKKAICSSRHDYKQLLNLCFASSSLAGPSDLQELEEGQTSPTSEAGTAGASTEGTSELSSAGKELPKQHQLIAAFTCNKCGARTARGFSKAAYERGVVIARCGGCQVQHLLSDKLGWFGEAGNIENFLHEKGQAIRKQTDGTVEIGEADLLGWSKGATRS